MNKGQSQKSILFQHDPDGNLIQDAKWTYHWNVENWLIAMESRDKNKPLRLEIRYDPQGRRITKTVYASTKGQGSIKWAKTHQSHFIYDGWNLIAESDATGSLL